MHIKARDSMGDDTGFITVEKYYADTRKWKEQRTKGEKICPVLFMGGGTSSMF